MEGRDNGRSAGDVKGIREVSTSTGGIFSENEWAQLIADLSLSPQQAKIVRHLFSSLSDKQIAAEMGIAAASVRTHLRRLFLKFGLQDRLELILYVFYVFRQTQERSIAV
jgi:DNA-binding CsgD family transcriptional regulator